MREKVIVLKYQLSTGTSTGLVSKFQKAIKIRQYQYYENSKNSGFIRGGE